jgi:spoIIIJ-associated protein
MQFDRFSGKTLEEALENAAAAKGMTAEEMTYTVTEEKSGFLGLGRQVEIEVWGWKDVAEFLRSYIQTYFDNAHMDGTVEVNREEDDFYRIDVDTNANAVLIGRGGNTLQDFNRLVRSAASAQFRKHIRILIDVNGYKEERYEKVVRMAVRAAKDVRRTKVDVALDPMPADERKAVHAALSNMKDISTKSEGEGPGRALHILYTPGKEGE